MKVAILAGGTGSRLSEQTAERPKALVEIGGRPILWHVMQHYCHYGFDDFAIALGYKGECIREYFVTACAERGQLRVSFSDHAITAGKTKAARTSGKDQSELWPSSVDLIDTGATTATGGRIKRLAPWLGNETFMLTWCDGLANVDLAALLQFHRSHGKLATVTAVHPPGRFGRLDIRGQSVTGFEEKPERTEQWINGAFFVLEPDVLNYIDGDHTQWEAEPMQQLVKDNQLMAWQHDSYWQCMDTLKEQQQLQSLWDSGQIPWREWL